MARKPESNGKRTCFEAGGHRTKSGKECCYFLPPGETSCPHHAADKSRQTEILQKAQRQRKEAAILNVDTNDFQSIDDCLRVRAEVVKILCREKTVDHRRLDAILKACSGASQDHSTKILERQNEILLSLSGHGAGVAMLERLRNAPLRVLPGRKKALDVEAVIDFVKAKEPSADTQPVPSTTPEQEA